MLVVEDDAVCSKLLNKWISKRYDVTLVEDGSQGWDLLQHEHFDLVLADKNTPKMDGIQLLECIVKSNSGIPVLLMSAENALSLADQVLAKGSYDFLTKPFSESVVMQRIQTILELHKSEQRNMAYKRHMEENLQEMRRLQEEARNKDAMAKSALSALEAPIVGITSTLAKVVENPELEKSPIKKSLEEILRMMMKDVYRPALERVLSSTMDPLAMSLLQSYCDNYAAGGPASGGTRKGSRKGSVFSSEVCSDPELDIKRLRLDDWAFDCWGFTNKQLLKMLPPMFMYWVSEDLTIDESKLRNFLADVEQAYLDNPYHSFRHAFDVTQTLFALILSLGDNASRFSNLDMLVMLISALCHDLGHPGLTNKFLIVTTHELALRYNDRSVLENFHCSYTFELLLKKQNNFFTSLSAEAFRQVRQDIISCILATDMAQHFTALSKLETRLGTTEFTAADRVLFMETLVHTADISNVTKPWDLAYRWSTAVTTEFFNQGDREKELGLPVEAFMDRSKSNVEINTANFIKFVCSKYFQLVSQVFPSFAVHLPQMDKNLEMFLRLSEIK